MPDKWFGRSGRGHGRDEDPDPNEVTPPPTTGPHNWDRGQVIGRVGDDYLVNRQQDGYSTGVESFPADGLVWGGEPGDDGIG